MIIKFAFPNTFQQILQNEVENVQRGQHSHRLQNEVENVQRGQHSTDLKKRLDSTDLKKRLDRATYACI